MSGHLDDGHTLARRILDAHASRIYQLPGAARAEFVAGLISGMVGGAAGLLGPTAIVPLLENLIRQLNAVAADEQSRAP